jgi:hypothetical protein
MNKGQETEHSTANVSNEPVLKTEFYVALFSKNRGLFEQAFDADSSTSVLLNRVVHTCGADISGAVADLHLFVKKTFMGCVDCNIKMTISEFIERLFGMLFHDTMYDAAPKKGNKKAADHTSFEMDNAGSIYDSSASTTPIPGVSKQKKLTPRAYGFDSEMMLHYIMLCGLLKTGDQLPHRPGRNSRHFKIVESSADEVRRKTWLLKCIMMWCSLQILFCNWKMAVLFDGLRHHTLRQTTSTGVSLIFTFPCGSLLYIRYVHAKRATPWNSTSSITTTRACCPSFITRNIITMDHSICVRLC